MGNACDQPRIVNSREPIDAGGTGDESAKDEVPENELADDENPEAGYGLNPVEEENVAKPEENTAEPEEIITVSAEREDNSAKPEAPSLWGQIAKFATDVVVKKEVEPKNEQPDTALAESTNEQPKDALVERGNEKPKSVPRALPKGHLSREAERRAQELAEKLIGDMSEEDISRLSDEAAKHALSRERLNIVMEGTEGLRMTCAQLDNLVRLVTLDAHKEQVILARYAHLTDKPSFKEVVVAQFSLSKSMRENLLAKLMKSLTQDSQ